MLKLLLKSSLCATAALGAMALAPAAPSGNAPASAPIVQSRDSHDRHVVIKNRTGWTMLRFYASDARTDDWEEDILGDRILSDGADIRINIDDGSGACVYDFKAEFTHGETLTRFGVNVCEISTYTYTR